jgi:hypothetical protein
VGWEGGVFRSTARLALLTWEGERSGLFVAPSQRQRRRRRGSRPPTPFQPSSPWEYLSLGPESELAGQAFAEILKSPTSMLFMAVIKSWGCEPARSLYHSLAPADYSEQLEPLSHPSTCSPPCRLTTPASPCYPAQGLLPVDLSTFWRHDRESRKDRGLRGGETVLATGAPSHAISPSGGWGGFLG